MSVNADRENVQTGNNHTLAYNTCVLIASLYVSLWMYHAPVLLLSACILHYIESTYSSYKREMENLLRNKQS